MKKSLTSKVERYVISHISDDMTLFIETNNKLAFKRVVQYQFALQKWKLIRSNRYFVALLRVNMGFILVEDVTYYYII